MKGSYRWGNIVFTGLMFVFVLSMVLGSLQYSAPVDWLLPLFVGSLTLVLVILSLIGEIYPRLQRKVGVGLFNGDATQRLLKLTKQEEEAEKLAGIELGKRVLIAVAWISSYVLLIFLLGYHIAIPTVVLAFLKLYSKMSWLRSIVVVAALSAFTLGVFEIGLGVDLFKGILCGEMVPIFR